MSNPQFLFDKSGDNMTAYFSAYQLPILMPEYPMLRWLVTRFDAPKQLINGDDILLYDAMQAFYNILLGGRPFAEGVPELVITGVSAGPGSTSCSINWVTNLAASSKVYYGLTDEYGESVEDTDLAFYHTLVIPGLLPNTTYHFKVESQTPQGQIADTEDDTFLTLSRGGGIWPVLMRLIYQN